MWGEVGGGGGGGGGQGYLPNSRSLLLDSEGTVCPPTYVHRLELRAGT